MSEVGCGGLFGLARFGAVVNLKSLGEPYYMKAEGILLVLRGQGYTADWPRQNSRDSNGNGGTIERLSRCGGAGSKKRQIRRSSEEAL